MKIVDAVLVAYRNRMQRDNLEMNFLPGHPIYEVVYYILDEERKIVGHLGSSRCALPSITALSPGR